MGVYIWKERLPSAYQEVEYIESSRTQVINTGVIPTTQTYTAELEVESTQSGTEYWAFGIWGTTGFRGGQDSSGHWDTAYGASYEPSSYNLNTKTKITMSNSGKGTSTDTAIGLFGMGESGAYADNRKGAYKIYYCKIWNSGTLIRDFVPCYRISDSVIGMYDLVNNQFYTNSGSGTFTKGQDINYVEHELQNAYIGEYQEEWQPGANTLLYLPMNSTDTYLDKSGNNVQTTNNGVTFGEYQGVDCGYFNRNHIQITPFSIPLDTTLLCWCYNTGVYQSSYDGKVFDARNNNNSLGTVFVPASNECRTFVNGTNVATSSCPQNQWVLIIVTNTDGQQNISVKGNGINLSTDGAVSFSTFTPTYINVGNEWNNGASRYFLGGMSELILEDKIRTAQEKLNYYNQTKSLYGIS